jgi:ABC-2 type transport system permease protein
MRRSLSEEFYKFIHEKIAWIGILAMVIMTFYGAVGKVTPKIISMGFGAGQWIVIVLFAISSTFFAIEYQHRTIIAMLYKHSHKSDIYFSKLFVLFLYNVFLSILSIPTTFLVKLICFPHRFSWTIMVNAHQNVWQALIVNTFGNVIYGIFAITLSFTLYMWLKNNVAVIGIGLFMGFMGSALSAASMDFVPSLIGILKWNPFNLIFITQQLIVPDTEKMSHLTNPELIGANLIYSLILSIVGLVLFKRRQV